jgi:hypothetical protein
MDRRLRVAVDAEAQLDDSPLLLGQDLQGQANRLPLQGRAGLGGIDRQGAGEEVTELDQDFGTREFRVGERAE